MLVCGLLILNFGVLVVYCFFGVIDWFGVTPRVLLNLFVIPIVELFILVFVLFCADLIMVFACGLIVVFSGYLLRDSGFGVFFYCFGFDCALNVEVS